jgi:hypothetical protein
MCEACQGSGEGCLCCRGTGVMIGAGSSYGGARLSRSSLRERLR